MAVILVVEDNPVALRMVEYILGHAGYTTLGAGRGDEALQLLIDNAIDIAVVDFGLPDMTGVELVQALRKHNPTLPVMMLTADTFADTHEQAIAAGVAIFLNKPLSSTELLAAIKKLLNL